MVDVPAPTTMAPMRLRKAARSAISGSRAALSMTVVPLASTAASSRFSVAPTLGNSSTMRAPNSSSARASMYAVAKLELGAHLLEAAQVHVDRAGPEVVAAGHGHPGPADPAEQRAEHDDRRPHALDELVRAPRAARRARARMIELVALGPADRERPCRPAAPPWCRRR